MNGGSHPFPPSFDVSLVLRTNSLQDLFVAIGYSLKFGAATAFPCVGVRAKFGVLRKKLNFVTARSANLVIRCSWGTREGGDCTINQSIAKKTAVFPLWRIECERVRTYSEQCSIYVLTEKDLE